MYVLAKPINGELSSDFNGSSVLFCQGDVALRAIGAADLSHLQSLNGRFG